MIQIFRTVWNSWKLLFPRHQIALGFLLSARVLLNLLDILSLTLLATLIAMSVGEPDSNPLGFNLGPLQDLSLEVFLGVTLLTFLLRAVFNLLLYRVTVAYLARAESFFSDLLATEIFFKSYSKFKTYSRSDIDWNVLRSTQKALPGVLGNAISLVAEASLALVVFSVLVFADWEIAIAVTLYFGVIILLFHFGLQRIVTKAGEDFTSGTRTFHQVSANLFETFEEGLVLRRTRYFLQDLNRAREKVAKSEARAVYLAQIPRSLVELALVLGAIGFVGLQTSEGFNAGDAPTVGLFLVGSLRIMSALLPLQRSAQYLRFEGPIASSAQNLISEAMQALRGVRTDPDVLDKCPQMRAKSDPGIHVEVSSVDFVFVDNPPSPTFLDGVSLEARPGELVAIIGPSGGGKSTLLSIISGLSQPSKGKVLCDGLAPAELTRLHPGQIAFVPQRPGLVSGTIAENIALGVPSEEIDAGLIREVLGLVALLDFVDESPNGIDTDLGAQSDSLSGGQIQRLGLARALYARPRLLLLDEATSQLDAGTEANIVKSLEWFRGTMTQIVVAHRLSTVKKADRVFVMNRGKMVASGTFDFLAKNDPLVRDYVSFLSLSEETS